MSNPLNKIVNPETGYRVDVNGKIGKRVLRNYLKILGGGNGKLYPLRDCSPRTIEKEIEKRDGWAPGKVPHTTLNVTVNECTKCHRE